jgi:lipopolysaccharide export system protein LptA
MKRKILLMAGTFIVLLLAFGTYQLFVPGIALFNPEGHWKPLWPQNLNRTGKPDIRTVRGITIYDRSGEGELRGVYKVARWDKADDGSFLLDHPTAVIFHGDGRRTYMRADEGQIWAEEVANGFNVRHGMMKGNVKVWFDQSRRMERKHPEDRPHAQRVEECIEITVEDIAFDRDLLEIKTDSRVTLWSSRLDIVGRGLKILWNEEPRELRLLQIDKGFIMVVKQLEEQMDMIQLPVPETQPTTQPGQDGAIILTGPAESQPAQTQPTTQLATTQPAESQPAPQAATSAPASQNVADLWNLKGNPQSQPATASADEPALAAASQPQSQPATQPGSTKEVKIGTLPTDDDGRVVILEPGTTTDRNVFKATFHEEVRIHAGRRKLLGAVELALQFEWDRSWRTDDDDEKDKSAPAYASSRDKPNERLATGRPTSETQAAAALTTQPAEELAPQSYEDTGSRMEIYWDGPLTILPIGHTETPSRDHYKVTGHGENVILSAEQARVICQAFSFQNPRQKAVFSSKADRPAILQLAGGDEVRVSDSMSFDRSTGIAEMIGRGEMVRYIDPPEYVGPELLGVWAKQPVSQRVKWDDRVLAHFSEREFATATGGSERRPFVKDATFYKDVKLQQLLPPADESVTPDQQQVGDYVYCDELKVTLETTIDGDVYPTRADATGNVRARQQASNITAEKATVFFRPAADSDATATSQPVATDQTASFGGFQGGGNIEPTAVDASGKVTIHYVDATKPDEPPLKVQADKIQADLLEELGVLTGSPAKIAQGENLIEGEVIHLDENSEAVLVTGAGRLAFLTDQDLSGNALARKRPIKIQWTRKMLYHGQSGQGVFAGDVDLDSGEDLLQAGELRLFFEKETNPRQRKAKAETRSLGLGVDSYSSREIHRIEAISGKGDKRLALMRAQRTVPGASEQLQQRMELRGEKVLYDARSGDTKVLGQGTFLAEDYRPPKPGRRSAPRGGQDIAMASMQLERPSQTLFTWKKQLFLSQRERHINLQENVTMVHRSGGKVLVMKGLKHPDWGKLSEGRKSTLRAGEVDAWFDEPLRQETTGQGDILDSGPQFGTLRMFTAVDSVTFSDGPYTIDGQRVLYEGFKRLLTVWGYLPNADTQTSARVTYEDPQTGRLQTWESPTIIWDMRRDSIKIEKFEGGGGL